MAKIGVFRKNDQKQAKMVKNSNFYEKTSLSSILHVFSNLRHFCTIIAICLLRYCLKCDRVILMKKAHHLDGRINKIFDSDFTLNEKDRACLGDEQRPFKNIIEPSHTMIQILTD